MKDKPCIPAFPVARNEQKNHQGKLEVAEVGGKANLELKAKGGFHSEAPLRNRHCYNSFLT